jgi:serine/threonine protein kinase
MDQKNIIDVSIGKIAQQGSIKVKEYLLPEKSNNTERSQLNNDIKYITPSELRSTYLKNAFYDSSIVSGFGEILFSDKYVIKKFVRTSTIEDLITELDIYSSLSHPCILKPVAWSIFSEQGYLIMPKGIPIKKAFIEGKITIEQIIADTLSAICYMNSKGFAHKDCKPGNMVYYEDIELGNNGRCMIIDMGLSCKSTLNEDGEYYIKGTGYTSDYRDPEYYYKQYNNIKVEIYSLAMSYKTLLTNKSPRFGDLIGYKCGKPHIDWFFEEATKFLEDRSSIQELLNNAPKKLIPPSRRYETVDFPETPIIYNNSKQINYCINYAQQIAISDNLDSKTVFLCFHLIYRIYDKIIIKYGERKAFLHKFVIICMKLAKIVTKENKTNFTKTEIKMVIELLVILKGSISSNTYWDYAETADDLKIPLGINNELSLGNNKCVLFNEIVSPYEFKKVHNLQFSDTKNKKIQPCKINVGSDIKIIQELAKSELEWDGNSCKLYLGALLRNKNVLKHLPIDTSINIFRVIYKYILISERIFKTIREGPIICFILNTLCDFNWREWGSKINNENNIHPFQTKNQELIECV